MLRNTSAYASLRRPARLERFLSARAAKTVNTADAEEIKKFNRMADEWWNPTGIMQPLHAMNPTRLGFIRSSIDELVSNESATVVKPLEGLSVLDIGCGGGILSEPLARLGGNVLGVDAAGRNIQIAKAHAKRDPLFAKGLEYRNCTAEDLVAEGKQFDVVSALEIVEHVADVPAFIQCCASLVKPNGLLFMSTLNRTPASYLGAIVMAEQVLNWVPRGTHSWSKFITPAELEDHLRTCSMTVLDTAGMAFNPFSRLGCGDSWRESSDTSTNYILVAKRIYAA